MLRDATSATGSVVIGAARKRGGGAGRGTRAVGLRGSKLQWLREIVRRRRGREAGRRAAAAGRRARRPYLLPGERRSVQGDRCHAQADGGGKAVLLLLRRMCDLLLVARRRSPGEARHRSVGLVSPAQEE